MNKILRFDIKKWNPMEIKTSLAKDGILVTDDDMEIGNKCIDVTVRTSKRNPNIEVDESGDVISERPLLKISSHADRPIIREEIHNGDVVRIIKWHNLSEAKNFINRIGKVIHKEKLVSRADRQVIEEATGRVIERYLYNYRFHLLLEDGSDVVADEYTLMKIGQLPDSESIPFERRHKEYLDKQRKIRVGEHTKDIESLRRSVVEKAQEE